MDNYSCPSCQRDYEICRRYVIREDDMEFSVTPRILKCLHTCCTSCLEDMVQKNMRIICPLCKDPSVVKGVRYLPFDGCAMLEAVKSDVTTMMSFCSRCHDEVPTFSWCVSCSTPLCEFHHNDHKRSVDTSHHKMYTLTDIAKEHIAITPHLPPIPCPDAFGEECSIFCHTCAHPVSASAMIQYHKTHRYDDVSSLKPVAMDEMKHCLRNLGDMKDNLKEAVDNIKNTMRRLDRAVDATATEIVEEIEACRAALAERENKLLQRLESVANEKRLLLTNQLNEVSDLHEECKAAESCGSAVMQHLPQEQNGVYMMATKPVVQAKYEQLNRALDTVTLPPVCNPKIACAFSAVDKEILHNVVATLGALYVKDFNDVHAIKYDEIAGSGGGTMSPVRAVDAAEVKAETSKSSLASPAAAAAAGVPSSTRQSAISSPSKDAAAAPGASSAATPAAVSSVACSKKETKTSSPEAGGGGAVAGASVSSAQFSVRMSPNISVENVHRREIRSIRTSVVEIRAAAVPSKLAAGADGPSFALADAKDARNSSGATEQQKEAFPMPTPPPSAPSSCGDGGGANNNDKGQSVTNEGDSTAMPATPHPHLTVSGKGPADDQTCPITTPEQHKRVWRKEPRIATAIANAKATASNAASVSSSASKTPQHAHGRMGHSMDTVEGSSDDEDALSHDDDLRRDLHHFAQTGKQIQMLRQRKFVEAVATGLEDGISRRFGGEVIGRVVVVNEAAQSALAKHELRTLFESLTHGEDGLPVLRITNEIVSKR